MNSAIFINEEQLESIPVLKEIRDLHNEIQDANDKIQMRASEIFFVDDHVELKPTIRINEELLKEECEKIICAGYKLKKMYAYLK